MTLVQQQHCAQFATATGSCSAVSRIPATVPCHPGAATTLRLVCHSYRLLQRSPYHPQPRLAGGPEALQLHASGLQAARMLRAGLGLSGAFWGVCHSLGAVGQRGGGGRRGGVLKQASLADSCLCCICLSLAVSCCTGLVREKMRCCQLAH